MKKALQNQCKAFLSKNSFSFLKPATNSVTFLRKGRTINQSCSPKMNALASYPVPTSGRVLFRNAET
ncbi:MAG: hypothetical protein COV79_03435 [Parcubacteria group bacterium CG11_big_fil_rev_8_21_14_0_20_41_14]|nr:MAG: hypothetical protein COV79_03435 [Parcubacteria group bacterium CG11_big_fil_rev_8_21_14_0_20_41_14]